MNGYRVQLTSISEIEAWDPWSHRISTERHKETGVQVVSRGSQRPASQVPLHHS